MTKETPGFDENNEPDVSDGASGEDAAKAATAGKADAPSQEGASAPAGDAGLLAQLDQVRTALGERTADLQRLQAEYQNYRRRVERDRVTVKEIAVANLLGELLPVLDDIGRAREHGELVGGFKSVAESLEAVTTKMGLQNFGKEGEPFDPTIHEALMHSYAPDVTETTCVAILQPGYRFGERTIRPARVAVAEPQPGAQPADAKDDTSGAKGKADGKAGGGKDAKGKDAKDAGSGAEGSEGSDGAERGGPDKG